MDTHAAVHGGRAHRTHHRRRSLGLAIVAAAILPWVVGAFGTTSATATGTGPPTHQTTSTPVDTHTSKPGHHQTQTPTCPPTRTEKPSHTPSVTPTETTSVTPTEITPTPTESSETPVVSPTEIVGSPTAVGGVGVSGDTAVLGVAIEAPATAAGSELAETGPTNLGTQLAVSVGLLVVGLVLVGGPELAAHWRRSRNAGHL